MWTENQPAMFSLRSHEKILTLVLFGAVLNHGKVRGFPLRLYAYVMASRKQQSHRHINNRRFLLRLRGLRPVTNQFPFEGLG